VGGSGELLGVCRICIASQHEVVVEEFVKQTRDIIAVFSHKIADVIMEVQVFLRTDGIMVYRILLAY
jgi:hypothetical protein